MPKVYDANGNTFDVESVDAREYVASGNYFYENPLEVKDVEEEKPVELTESIELDHKKKSKK